VTGVDRRRDGLELGCASQAGVERLESPGGNEEQRWRVAPARAPKRDLRPQPLQPRALEPVERRERGGVQQLERLVRCGRVELRLRSGQPSGDNRAQLATRRDAELSGHLAMAAGVAGEPAR
jgi:hypothetical protein